MSYKINDAVWEDSHMLCEPNLDYSRKVHQYVRELGLFDDSTVDVHVGDIKVIELFAGVGGFRIGFERASKHYKVVWSNQWEPSTKRQDASIIYSRIFGVEGHSNIDIAKVPTAEIPDGDLLCGGFPCQDYSVATTLNRSEGIEGKKGVLWWEIYRILKEKGEKRPKYLMLENVDRLLNSPARQRGRDFAIILASLASLGYMVEWRIINAADYGMPQKRRRTYIVGYQLTTPLAQQFYQDSDKEKWVLYQGIFAQAFQCIEKDNSSNLFKLDKDIEKVSNQFNKGKKDSPFKNAGVMCDSVVYTRNVLPSYDGAYLTLGEMLLDENQIPQEFFISEEELPNWRYQKGAKSLMRMNKVTGFEYRYSEGSMTFPDKLDSASRTIITGEGGSGVSRFKHIIQTESGRYRRLVPIELERLNMFPDNHTAGASDLRRAFLMGNALVTGIVERLALVLESRIKEK